MAFQMKGKVDQRSLLCPMLDARRMEVYCTVVDAIGNEILPIQAKIIDADSFHDLLSTNAIAFFGDGANKCRTVIRHPHANFIDNIYPQAFALGLVAAKKLERNEVENIESFEPIYLRSLLQKLQH